MKDGQGLEVANADANAIEALDFLREEWLVFGKRDRGFTARSRPLHRNRGGVRLIG